MFHLNNWELEFTLIVLNNLSGRSCIGCMKMDLFNPVNLHHYADFGFKSNMIGWLIIIRIWVFNRTVHLWREFVRFLKGKSWVKILPAIEMYWNFSIGTVDWFFQIDWWWRSHYHPHPECYLNNIFVSSFFSVHLANSYRVWKLYKREDSIANKYHRAISGEIPASKLRYSARQLLRRDPFYKFPEISRAILVEMSKEAFYTSQQDSKTGARNPEERIQPPRK